MKPLALALAVCLSAFSTPAQDFHAGVARADITPTKPIRLAGYASRSKPHESVEQRIHVKALALKDAAGATTRNASSASSRCRARISCSPARTATARR
jgi:hypothetical protein